MEFNENCTVCCLTPNEDGVKEIFLLTRKLLNLAEGDEFFQLLVKSDFFRAVVYRNALDIEEKDNSKLPPKIKFFDISPVKIS
jgi:hypothetical protein